MEVQPTQTDGTQPTCERCGDRVPLRARVDHVDGRLCEVCHSRSLKEEYTTRRRHRREPDPTGIPEDPAAVAEAAAAGFESMRALYNEQAELEYRLRKDPENLGLLEKLLDIAEITGAHEAAAELRRRICQIDPHHLRIQGKPIAQRKNRLVEVPAGNMSFVEELMLAVLFPLRGRGAWMLLCAAVLITLSRLVGSTYYSWSLSLYGGPLYGAVFMVVVWGLAIRQWTRIAESSARAETEVPGWADFGDIFTSTLRPIAGAVGVAFVAFLPFLISFAIRVASPGGETLLLIPMGIAFLFGLYVAPILFLAYSRFDDLSVVAHVPFLARSIARTKEAYHRLVWQVLVLVGGAATIFVPLELARRVSGLGALLYYIVSSVILYHLGCVAFHLLGLFYLKNQKELNWFQEVVRAEPPRQPPPPFPPTKPPERTGERKPPPQEPATPPVA